MLLGKALYAFEHDIELIALPQPPVIRGGLLARHEPVTSSVLMLHRVRSVRALMQWRRATLTSKFNHLDQALFDGVLMRGVFALVQNDLFSPKAPFARYICNALLTDRRYSPFLFTRLIDTNLQEALNISELALEQYYQNIITSNRKPTNNIDYNNPLQTSSPTPLPTPSTRRPTSNVLGEIAQSAQQMRRFCADHRIELNCDWLEPLSAPPTIRHRVFIDPRRFSTPLEVYLYLYLYNTSTFCF